MSTHALSIVCLGLALVSGSAAAVVRTWPDNAGPCPKGTTLQACIDGAALSDYVAIATNDPIGEDILIVDRNLYRLEAAEGYKPTFAPGRSVEIHESIETGSVFVNLSGLSFIDGHVIATHSGMGNTSIGLVGLTLTRSATDMTNFIEVDGTNGLLAVNFVNNRVTDIPSPGQGLVRVHGHGGALSVGASENHVSSTSAGSTNGAGIAIDVDDFEGNTGTTANIILVRNELRGGFSRGGMEVGAGRSSTATIATTMHVQDNVSICDDGSAAGGIGMQFLTHLGTMNAVITNNTISRCGIGIYAGDPDASGGSVYGTLGNNVIVANGALAFLTDSTTLLAEDYNLINGGSSISLGLHSTTAPAQLVLDTQPRLRAASPAIDAGNDALLELLKIDADGLRRVKGSSVDMGAYEFGDVMFTHVATSNTINDNLTVIDQSSLNFNPGAALVATPNYNLGVAGGVDFDHPFGTVYLPLPEWSLFNQDAMNAMPLGASFDVMVPASGMGSSVHVSTAANTTASITRLSGPDALPPDGAVVLVTQNGSAGGMGVSNPHPIGFVFVLPILPGIANVDGADMAQNLGFNIYWQEPSVNAWHVLATVDNLSGDDLRLDHPLLDNTPCARPQASRVMHVGDSPISGNFILEYLGSNWYIRSYSGIVPGNQFDVIVNPAQVFECTDRIFENGYQ